MKPELPDEQYCGEGRYKCYCSECEDLESRREDQEYERYRLEKE